MPKVRIGWPTLLLGMLLIPTAQAAAEGSDIRGTFQADGAAKLQGSGLAEFQLGGFSYGGRFLPQRGPMPPPAIAYSLSVQNATLELWETTSGQIYQQIAGAPPTINRVMESEAFSGTVYLDTAAAPPGTVHAFAAPAPMALPLTVVQDVSFRMQPLGRFSANLEGPESSDIDSPIDWSDSPANQSFHAALPHQFAQIDFGERAQITSPFTALFLGGTIRSEGSVNQEWQTGHTSPAQLGVFGSAPPNRYHYLVIHANEGLLDFGLDSSSWVSRVRGLSATIEGDALWQGVNGEIQFGDNQTTHRGEAFQAIGAMDIRMDWPYGGTGGALRGPYANCTWTIAGQATFVAVDTQAVVGQRAELIVVSVLSIAVVLYLLSPWGKAPLLALFGRRLAPQDRPRALLENPTRRMILRALFDGLPQTAADLAASIGKSRSTVRFHVKILAAQGLLAEVRPHGRRKTAYVLGKEKQERPTLLLHTTYANPARRALFEVVEELGPMDFAAIQAALGTGRWQSISLSRSAASRHLAALVAAGALTQQWVARRKVYAAVQPLVTDAVQNEVLNALGVPTSAEAVDQQADRRRWWARKANRTLDDGQRAFMSELEGTTHSLDVSEREVAS